MPSNVFKSKRHDTGVSPEVVLTPPTGLTWDLQEAGIVARFIARTTNAPSPKINAAAVVTGPWTVRYDPIAADVNTIGNFDVEVEITRANGKKITLPTDGFLTWQITTDLDNA